MESAWSQLHKALSFEMLGENSGMKKKIWALVVGIACVLGSVFEVYVTLKLDPAISEQILRLLSI